MLMNSGKGVISSKAEQSDRRAALRCSLRLPRCSWSLHSSLVLHQLERPPRAEGQTTTASESEAQRGRAEQPHAHALSIAACDSISLVFALSSSSPSSRIHRRHASSARLDAGRTKQRRRRRQQQQRREQQPTAAAILHAIEAALASPASFTRTDATASRATSSSSLCPSQRSLALVRCTRQRQQQR